MPRLLLDLCASFCIICHPTFFFLYSMSLPCLRLLIEAPVLQNAVPAQFGITDQAGVGGHHILKMHTRTRLPCSDSWALPVPALLPLPLAPYTSAHLALLVLGAQIHWHQFRNFDG